jgi:hypothetical protein
VVCLCCLVNSWKNETNSWTLTRTTSHFYFIFMFVEMSNTLTTLTQLSNNSAGLKEIVVSQCEEKIGLHQRSVTSVEMRTMLCDDLDRSVCPHFKRCTVKQPPRASQAQLLNLQSFTEKTSSIEANIFEELKKLRFNPVFFLEELQRRRASVVGSTLWCGGSAVRLAEGPSVIDEAIDAVKQFCMHFKAPKTAQLEAGLSLAARDLGLDLGPKGLVCQRGTDESTVSDRVSRYGSWDLTVSEIALFGTAGYDPVDVIAQILINDGVPSRIHQKALLNVELAHIGICVVPHTKATTCVIIVLAQSFTPNSISAMQKIHECVPTRLPPQNTCEYCRGDIDLRRCVYGIKGKPFHKNCFLCKICKSTLEDVFFERNECDSLCKSCVMFRCPPTCTRCTTRISEPSPQFKRNDSPLCGPCFTEEAKGLAEQFPFHL